MGNSYGKPVTQWSAGEYAGATNQQDDLGVMADNGVDLIGDDQGDTTATATVLPVNTVGGGLTSTRTDLDYFKGAPHRRDRPVCQLTWSRRLASRGARRAPHGQYPLAHASVLSRLVTLRRWWERALWPSSFSSRSPAEVSSLALGHSRDSRLPRIRPRCEKKRMQADP
jgi:hypothetical protein